MEAAARSRYLRDRKPTQQQELLVMEARMKNVKHVRINKKYLRNVNQIMREIDYFNTVLAQRVKQVTQQGGQS